MNSIPDPLAISDVHVWLPSDDHEASTQVYGVLLGATTRPGWSAAANGGVGLRPASSEALAVDLRVADLSAGADLLRRRGLTLSPDDGSLAIDAAAPLRITDDSLAQSGSPMIDHVVLTMPDVDGTVALFGGRLGINLRLVRELGDGVSRLFFRTATAVIEIITGPGADAGGGEGAGIGLMGVAWRTSDIDAEHARLTAAGLAVSEVRPGRKAGTRVCTVREPALATATLLIEHGPTE